MCVHPKTAVCMIEEMVVYIKLSVVCFFTAIQMSTSITSPPAGATEWRSTPSFTNTGRNLATKVPVSVLGSACPLFGPILCYLMLHETRVSFAHRPDLIDFDKLKKSNAHYNLQNAFNLAEQHLGLTKLLDPEGENLLLPFLSRADFQ